MITRALARVRRLLGSEVRAALSPPSAYKLPCIEGPLRDCDLVVHPGDRELWVWRPEGALGLLVETSFPMLALPGLVLGCYLVAFDATSGTDVLAWRKFPQPGDVVAEVATPLGRSVQAVALAPRGD